MSQGAVDSFAESRDWALLRQSALSLLADVLVAAHWSVGRLLTDVLDVAVGVIKMERGVSFEATLSIRCDETCC